MKKSILTGLLLTAGLTQHVQATELYVGLNDNVISTDLKVNFNRQANGNIEYIYSDIKGKALLSGLHVTHDAGAHHYEIGAKFTYLWSDHYHDGSVIGVGGLYALDLGSNLSIQSSAYYSPSVLSFNKMDSSLNLDSKLQFKLNRDVGLFVGYRNMSFKYENGVKRSFDSGFYAGIKAIF